SLARRKRRAWQLAVALVAVSAAAHLAKGLDVEEASVHLVLLAALWRYRREFVAPGDPKTIRPLVHALAALGAVGVLTVLRFAHDRAWRVAILGASAELLPLYRASGLRSIYLGDEAVVSPAEFSLEGRAIRKVRQSVHRVRRAGYRVRFVRPAEVTPELRAELERVSHEWRGRWPERGFTMAMDALFAHEEGMLAVAESAGGEVGGFLQLVPSPASGGYSLAAMRRGKDTPNGLME